MGRRVNRKAKPKHTCKVVFKEWCKKVDGEYESVMYPCSYASKKQSFVRRMRDSSRVCYKISKYGLCAVIFAKKEVF